MRLHQEESPVRKLAAETPAKFNDELLQRLSIGDNNFRTAPDMTDRA